MVKKSVSHAAKTSSTLNDVNTRKIWLTAEQRVLDQGARDTCLGLEQIEDDLARSQADAEKAYLATAPDDFSKHVVWAGESADLVNDVRSAAEIIERIVEQVADTLSQGARQQYRAIVPAQGRHARWLNSADSGRSREHDRSAQIHPSQTFGPMQKSRLFAPDGVSR